MSTQLHHTVLVLQAGNSKYSLHGVQHACKCSAQPHAVVQETMLRQDMGQSDSN